MTRGGSHDRAVDIAKGIGIFLVVYGHASEIAFMDVDWNHPLFPVWRYVYGFHMPLFFFLSGMVFKIGDDRRAWAGCLRLIAVAQLSNLAVLACEFAVGPEHDVSSFLVRIAKTAVSNSNFVLVVTWFLVATAIIRLAHHYFVRGGTVIRVFVVALLVLSYAAYLRTGSSVLQIQALLPGFVFHAMGHFAASLRPRLQRLPVAALPVSAAVLLGGGLLLSGLNGGCWASATEVCPDFGPRFAVYMLSGRIGFFPVFFVSALAASAGIHLLALVLERWVPTVAGWLGDLGERTIDVLLLNGVVLIYLNPLLRDRLVAEGGGIAAGIGLVAVVTVVQFAALPMSSLVTRRLRDLSDRLATAIVTAAGCALHPARPR